MSAAATQRVRAALRRALGAVGLEPRARSVELERRLEKTRGELDNARQRLARITASRVDLAQRVDGLAAELEAVRSAGDLASGRDRADLQYLFVLTYGRSGSTLLQGILSSTPGVIIRGENGGLFQDLFQFHQTATQHRDRLARTAPLPPSHPFWGIDAYRDETAYRDFRRLMLDTVLQPAPDTRIIGFKEIAWAMGRLPAMLAFARAVFPGARFVLNTRNLTDVAQSKWWAQNPNALAELQSMEQQYVDGLAALGDDGYRVHYDDYVADPTALRGLFDWLGLEFDEHRVREVLAVRHSY